ncbi:MAG: ABC transporter substrate-binding protein [Candidatus Levyibacteriota bacterium]
MDENVLFNPNSQDAQAATPATGDPAPQMPQEGEPSSDGTPGDPNAVPTEGDTSIVADESTGTLATDGTEAGFEEPPPPVGFFNGGLVKKLLIGVGILVLLIIIVSVVINLSKGQQAKVVTLEWWGLWEDNNTMQPLILDFEKTHPNIKVNYDPKDPKQYADQLMTRIKNGTGPDIFRYHNSWGTMLGSDVAALSSNVISADDFKKAYYPVMQQDLTYKGAIYGIPMEADTIELFVNPQLFAAAAQQVPTTWDQFNDAAKSITVRDENGVIKKSGAALGTYDNIMHAPDIISLLMAQQGVSISTIADYPKNEAGALAYYGSFAHGDNVIWNNNLDNSLLAFSKGNLAMYFGYSWDIFAIQRLNSNLQFKVYPVPSNQGVKTTIASYWVEGVSSKTTHVPEAMEFMHYLAQKDTAQKFYTETAKTRSFGELYARKDLQSSLSDNALVYPFVEGLDNATSTFFSSDTHDGDTGFNTLMNNYLKTAVNALTDDSNSATSAVDDLNNGIKQVFQKYAGTTTTSQ